MPKKGFKYAQNDRRYSSRSRENHWCWRNHEDKIRYASLHQWVYKIMGKANRCDNCGLKTIPKGKKRWFEWSCKDGKYGRNIDDWQQLCIPCHRKLDNWRDNITRGLGVIHYKEFIKL